MDIEKRLRESEQSFEEKKNERDQYLQSAEECFIEMTKLQGEFRLLQQMLTEQEQSRANKIPNKITAPAVKEEK